MQAYLQRKTLSDREETNLFDKGNQVAQLPSMKKTLGLRRSTTKTGDKHGRVTITIITKKD